MPQSDAFDRKQVFFHVVAMHFSGTNPYASYLVYYEPPRATYSFSEYMDGSDKYIQALVALFTESLKLPMPQKSQRVIQMGAFVAARLWAAGLVEVVSSSDDCIIIRLASDRQVEMKVLPGSSSEVENLFSVFYIID